MAYYRTLLKNKGTQIFDQPLTHIFEVGRYNEATMAFPPSVTIKDYASGGATGYLNPRPGAQPERFPTVIQIVPAPRCEVTARCEVAMTAEVSRACAFALRGCDCRYLSYPCPT